MPAGFAFTFLHLLRKLHFMSTLPSRKSPRNFLFHKWVSVFSFLILDALKKRGLKFLLERMSALCSCFTLCRCNVHQRTGLIVIWPLRDCWVPPDPLEHLWFSCLRYGYLFLSQGKIRRTYVAISIMKPLAKSCAMKLLLKLCWITLETGSLQINMEPRLGCYIESSYTLQQKEQLYTSKPLH